MRDLSDGENIQEEVGRLPKIFGGYGLQKRVAARRYVIPQATLRRRYLGLVKSPGKAALLRNEEFVLARNLVLLGDFGFAFNSEELRDFIKFFLDTHSRKIDLFRDNRPGPDWEQGFLRRNSNFLTSRLCQNISRKRAAVSEAVIEGYFNNLERTLEGIPPSNIINYDESIITDDPKGKLHIFLRVAKRAERIMNTTNSSTSIMFVITASGRSLSPYVVYKGERLQITWIEGGSIDTMYNVTNRENLVSQQEVEVVVVVVKVDCASHLVSQFDSDSEEEPQILATQRGSSTDTGTGTSKDLTERAAECNTGLKVADYVLVRFDAKKQLPRHYVGKVLQVMKDEIEVDIYREAECENKTLMAFKAPANMDECWVEKKDVVKTLKLIETSRATLFFEKDEFSGLLVR
ncbi:hypothetical protein Pcinc_008205 [Petrolisthes cinctipes]|uniref:Uncharacterized protein n=1 Tax=Petrolisthes cinctipes TaxID=88211 RepID=A0AAE1G9H9_PETCI|nr:hypothetical protein Pcinc_008205 [Petrolisthes cinctipes]